MDPKEIINFHLNRQKDKEKKEENEEVKLCPKCKSEMVKGSIRTSGNVNYQMWSCSKCSHEEADLVSLNDDPLNKI